MTEYAERLKKRALTIPEFCAAYGLGRSKTYELLNSKQLLSFTVGRRRLIAAEDAELWLATQKEAA